MADDDNILRFATPKSDYATQGLLLPYIDMRNWDEDAVPEQRWIVRGRIPRGQTVLFSGEGAAGKSTVTLHLCSASVLGRDWLGTLPEMGPALFIDAEDDEGVMHRRLEAIITHYGVRYGDMIKGGLHLVSLAGKDAVLATAGRGGRIEPTPLYQQILTDVEKIKPVIIGLASSANFFAGNEVDRAQVQQFIGLMMRLAVAANGSVVLVSHPSLTGITSDSGISGNTQWHNAVRARFYMKGVRSGNGEEPDSELREIVFKKSNYGPISETIVLRWRDGMFLPLPGVSSLQQAAMDAKAEDVFLILLRRFTVENRFVSDKPSRSYAPALFVKEDEAKKAGLLTARMLEHAMLRLFKAGTIWNEPCGKPSRPSYRIAIKELI